MGRRSGPFPALTYYDSVGTRGGRGAIQSVASPCWQPLTKHREPTATHTCLVCLSICCLQNPGPAWEAEADLSHTLLISPGPVPPPSRLCRAKRPGIVCCLTMEGRGCRREVPRLTLALFLGQKKASSCLATAGLETTVSSQRESARLGRPGSWGPFTNACWRARSPVRPPPPLRQAACSQ